MKVSIYGPNLPGSLQKLGTFVVHLSGCQHVSRMEYRGQDVDHVEVSTKLEAAEWVYPRGEFEWEREDVYIDDLYFAPCVDLPRRK